MQKIIFILLILNFYFFSAHAQEDCWSGTFSFSKCQDILETDAYIWAAMDGGLLKIDKTSEEVSQHYTVANSALPGQFISDLTIDNKGNLWMICRNKIAKFEGDKIIAFPKRSNGLVDEKGKNINARKIFIDKQEGIWVITENRKLLHYINGTWVQIKCNIISSNTFNSIAQDINENIWVATDVGPAKVINNTLELLDELHPLYKKTAYEIYTDKNRYLWFVTNDRLAKFDGHQFLDTFTNDLNSKSIALSIQENNGQVYGLMKDGIYFLEKNVWVKKLKTSKVHPPDRIYLDDNNRLWLFGNRLSGFKTYHPPLLHSIQLPELGAQGSSLRSIYESGDDVYLLGSSNIFHKNNSEVKAIYANSTTGYTGKICLSNNKLIVHAFYSHSSKSLFVEQIEPSKKQIIYYTDIKLQERCIVHAVEMREDTAWIFTNLSQYAYVLHKNELIHYTDYPFAMPLQNSFFSCTGLNNIWISDGIQLAHFDGNKWTVVRQENYPFNQQQKIRAFQADRQGNLWILASFRIFRFNKKNWDLFAKLPINRIFCSDPFHMQIDSNDNIWLGRRNELWKYEGETWSSVRPSNDQPFLGWILDMVLSQNEEKLYIGTYTSMWELDILCNEYRLKNITAVDVTHPSKTLDFDLSPNPTSSKITINLNTETTYPFVISIHDIEGTTLFSTTFKGDQKSVTINLPTYLAATTYLVSVQQGERSATKTMILIR